MSEAIFGLSPVLLLDEAEPFAEELARLIRDLLAARRRRSCRGLRAQWGRDPNRSAEHEGKPASAWAKHVRATRQRAAHETKRGDRAHF
jgi:hypothetical protein